MVSNDVKDVTTEEPSILVAPNDLPSAKAGSQSSVAAPRMSRGRKFLSYYKPYLGLFFADMACALIVSAITLPLPLCARYVTKDILEGGAPDSAQPDLSDGRADAGAGGRPYALRHVH